MYFVLKQIFYFRFAILSFLTFCPLWSEKLEERNNCLRKFKEVHINSHITCQLL